MLQSRIETLRPKKLVGLRINTNLAQQQTSELWRSFMMRRGEILGVIGKEMYSVQIFPKGYFESFSPQTEFEKWAAVEVEEVEHEQPIPQGMQNLKLPGGLYAVFLYKGAAHQAAAFFQEIFTVWLPASEYILDERPHFECMGDAYKNNHPDSEEEVWIPVKK